MENKHPNEPVSEEPKHAPKYHDDGSEDLGFRKMEYFKNQCRNILGPSKHMPKRVANIDTFDDEEFLEEKIHHVKGEDGRKLLLTKDYGPSVMDIVNAYKSLKTSVAKVGSGMNENRHTTVGGTKGYLKTTIAAQQHSKQQMNQELLVYALAASKLTSLLYF